MDDIVPKTFTLNLNSPHLQSDLIKFLEYFLECGKRGQNVWLLKPPDMNRGNGIKLFNDLDSFAELLENSTKKSK